MSTIKAPPRALSHAIWPARGTVSPSPLVTKGVLRQLAALMSDIAVSLTSKQPSMTIVWLICDMLR